MSTSNSWARFERVGPPHQPGDRVKGSFPKGSGYEKVTCRDRPTPPAWLRRGARRQSRRPKTLLPGPVPSMVFLQGITLFAGILSEQGPPIASDDWRKACRASGSETQYANKPYTPATHGKAERSQNHLVEGYVNRLPTSMNATAGYPRYLGSNNGSRCHMALGGLTPSAMPSSGCYR